MTRIYILQLIAGIAGGIIAGRKGRNIFVWFLLCFLLPLLILVLLLLPSLRSEAALMRCPSCSHPISRRDPKCSRCNWQRPIELIKCSSCGSFVPEDQKCPACSPKS